MRGEVGRALHVATEELQRRRATLQKANSTGVLLSVPEERNAAVALLGEAAAAAAAEAVAAAVDHADAPVRAVLQDALVSSDEGVRRFLHQCSTNRQSAADRQSTAGRQSAADRQSTAGRQSAAECGGSAGRAGRLGASTPSPPPVSSALLQSLLPSSRESRQPRQSRQSPPPTIAAPAGSAAASLLLLPTVHIFAELQLPAGALRAAGGRAGARGACLELVSTEARCLPRTRPATLRARPATLGHLGFILRLPATPFSLPPAPLHPA